MMRTAALIFCVLGPLFAQRHFEVASVKLETGRVRPDISISGLRFHAQAKWVYPLIVWAYNMRSYQVPSTPAIETTGSSVRYDIEGKAEDGPPPTKDEFRLMLQALLADRFHLRVHRETREMPVYALTIGKNGPKMRASAPDAEPSVHYGASGNNYVVTLKKATMSDVLDALENGLLDRPVVDRTGLDGAYDLEMIYAPGTLAKRRTEPDPDDISIFAAIEKLGLTLVPQKASVEVLIVDRVEKPSEN
jgi:uncharacterized protein (TIGR03435 family)